uniref:Cystatin domain-containing protein n=1 Tax=Steinernema glaseri TaxID=37863 RepID=A0A1I8AEC9_9BILA
RVAKEALSQMTICPVSLQILSARSQVVEGIKYDINLTYAPDFSKVHKLVVVSQPWKEDPYKVLSYT